MSVFCGIFIYVFIYSPTFKNYTKEHAFHHHSISLGETDNSQVIVATNVKEL